MKLQHMEKVAQDMQVQVDCRGLEFSRLYKIFFADHIPFFPSLPVSLRETALEGCYTDFPCSFIFYYKLKDNCGHVLQSCLMPQMPGVAWLPLSNKWVVRLNRSGGFLPGCRQTGKRQKSEQCPFHSSLLSPVLGPHSQRQRLRKHQAS